jgi:hypothetical protein
MPPDYRTGVGTGTPIGGQYGNVPQYGAPEQRFQQQLQAQGQPWYSDAWNGLRDMFGLGQQQSQQPAQLPVNQNDMGNPNISRPLEGSYSQGANTMYNNNGGPNNMGQALMARNQLENVPGTVNNYQAPIEQSPQQSLMDRFKSRIGGMGSTFNSGISRLRDLGGNIKNAAMQPYTRAMNTYRDWRNR